MENKKPGPFVFRIRSIYFHSFICFLLSDKDLYLRNKLSSDYKRNLDSDLFFH